MEACQCSLTERRHSGADGSSEAPFEGPLLRYLRNGLELAELTGVGVSGTDEKHGGQWARLEAYWVMLQPVALLL